MRFSLDVMRARKGDCLMLHFGSKSEPRLVMIDGGPAEVYRRYLRPRILQIREARGLDEQNPLFVDALMVSHVDDDHIKGVLDLTKELRTQKANKEPQLVRAASLWHNTFDDLLRTTPAELQAEAGFGAAALDGSIEVEDQEELDVAKVLASIPQGRVLRDDASFLAQGTSDWRVNNRFNGKLILATKDAGPVALKGGVTLRVIGPMQQELEALQKAHDTWLRQRRERASTSAESTLAAFIDKSVTNLSSIVLLAQADGKRILLTGDARGDKVLEGMEMTGLLAADGKSTIHVDVLKVPHHGSANNLAAIFFKRITADHYVFSGDGEHGNPERETMEMLFEARGNDPFVIHLTYPLDEIDEGRKADWEKEQAKEKKSNKKTPRPDWSPDKHALRKFFDRRPLARGQKLVEVESETRSHVIDLLDPIDF
jgi:beta-lactamase superfamily II metal-dependent hydrolase